MKDNNYHQKQRKILILSANPIGTDRLRLDEEVRDIEEGLQRSKYREQFKVDQKQALRLRDMRRAILDHEPQILHFTGHGVLDGFFVEDKNGFATIVPSLAFSNLLRLASDRIECVFLSACHSEAQTDRINKYIKYVIGMPAEIKEKAAIEYAVGFYDALGAGKGIEEAHGYGINAIQQYCPEIPDFMYPQLKVNYNIKTRKKRRYIRPAMAASLILAGIWLGLQLTGPSERPDISGNIAERSITTQPPPAKIIPPETESTKPNQDTQTPRSSQDEDVIVYVTPTGRKYHFHGCRHIKNKSNLRKLTITQAKEEGKMACLHCGPPE